jgi:hypothetical protein
MDKKRRRYKSMNLYYQNKLNLTLIIIVAFVSLLFWQGCGFDKPSAAIIEKAKIETRSILDSLDSNGNTIIADFKLVSQYFDKDMEKYLINYEIESGIDSAHITKSTTTAFIEQNNDNHWIYRFTFGETFERQLN